MTETPALTAAREILRQNVQDNREQMDLTDESRQLLSRLLGDQLEDRMRVAVAEGVTAAMTEENAARFVRAVVAETQKLATVKAGEVAGSVFKALIVKALTFTLAGWIVYSLGGWGALATVGKFFASSKG